eukprot:jgi/Mesvir1/1999/Mv17958-RA.1
MSTKLLPVDIEDADDGAGGGVSAPAVRGGAMDNVDIVDDDGGEWPGPVGAEAMPPSPQRDSVVQIIDDGGESAYDDASVAGDDVRTVQVDAGKKKPRKRGGGARRPPPATPRRGTESTTVGRSAPCSPGARETLHHTPGASEGVRSRRHRFR